MAYSAQDTAIVITDPQNDFLSPDGVIWGLVGASGRGKRHRGAH